METPQRWIVTYTKHLTQKRKVYKDGVLELHVPNDKVILFNDCGEVLETRFLKKNEVVESGGTVAFAAYLVDVAEREAESKALTGSECEIKSNESAGKTWTKTGKIARFSVSTVPLSPENKMCASFPASARRNRLSSIGDYAKGNKQAGSQNSEVAQSHPSSTGTTTKEWSALFTSQLTRKAKTYHDGILKLSFKGVYQKQVMLYDDSGKLLISKFLKKDEVVESGGSLTFDSYLVEIGNVKDGFKHLDGLDNKEQDKDSFTGSCMNKQQAGGKVESRLQTVAGAPIKLNCAGDSKRMACHVPSTDNTKSQEIPWHNKSFGVWFPLKTGEPQIGASSAKIVALDVGNSSVKNLMMNERCDINKSARDVREILAVLKRPEIEENLAPRELAEVQSTSSASEDLIQSNHLQSGATTSFQKESGATFLSTIEENTRDDSQMGASETSFPLSKAAQEIRIAGVTNSYHDSCGEKFFTGSESNSITPGSHRFPASNTQQCSTKQNSNVEPIASDNQEKPNQVQGNAGNEEVGPTGFEEASPSNPSNLLEYDRINPNMEHAELKSLDGGKNAGVVMDEIPGFDLGF